MHRQKEDEDDSLRRKRFHPGRTAGGDSHHGYSDRRGRGFFHRSDRQWGDEAAEYEWDTVHTAAETYMAVNTTNIITHVPQRR